MCGDGKDGSTPSDTSLILVHSRDSFQVMECTSANRKCGCTGSRFDHLGTRNAPLLVYCPQRELNDSPLIASHESGYRKRGTVDVRHVFGLYTRKSHVSSGSLAPQTSSLISPAVAFRSYSSRWYVHRSHCPIPFVTHLRLQSGPAVGICFCLIIVRLGHVFPVAREETWHMSNHTPASHPTASDLKTISFRKVEAKQDTFLGESEDHPMGTLDSQKQEYFNETDDLPKVIRASISLPNPV